MNSEYPIHCFEWKSKDLPFAEEFWQVEHPPKKFYVQGHRESFELLSRLPGCGLAVVGTRYPQERSLNETRRRILDLQGTSVVIVSGFATGIDQKAHESALEAGLKTIAILGSGLNKLYPSKPQLRDAIIEAGGLVISEFEPEMIALPHQFLQRNRLIASWSKATWVVEAGVRSGALNTANWARQYERNVFVTPCYPGDRALAGNQNLLECHNAFSLWSTCDFGTTWIELAAHVDSKAKTFDGLEQTELPLSDERVLAAKVADFFTAQGGVMVNQLSDWTLDLGWPPQRFFASLEKAIRIGMVVDDCGILKCKK